MKEKKKEQNRKSYTKIIIGIVVVATLAILVLNLNSILGYPKEKVEIKYFFAPTCPVCVVQEPILEKVMPEFEIMSSKQFVFEKKCLKVHEGDDLNCIKEFGFDEYNSFVKEAVELKVNGTPTFFFNEKKMTGLLKEEKLKEEICSALYGPLYFGKKISQCS